MTAQELRRAFIDFFVQKCGHKEIRSSSVIPEHDPTVLFTTAGMHPLVPYLMGESHPLGKRLVDAQKCVRTDDIDEVGDAVHCTFFEMLGNWSLGDYFKKEAIMWSHEFLTNVLKLDPQKISVSCFAGDQTAPRDEEAAAVWRSLGFQNRIFFYGKKENWWGPAGQTGPCGPDTEMFYDTGKPPCEHCATIGPACECRKFVEIWNDVFMEYNKHEDGSYSPLKQKNVDTGMGLERTLAILQGKETMFETELFAPVMTYLKSNLQDVASIESRRIIADHLRAAVFILGDENGVAPSNTDQGYIVRRLIRRAIRHGKKLGITRQFTHEIAEIFVPIYENTYSELRKNYDKIILELKLEEEKFLKTLEKGEKEFFQFLPQFQQAGSVNGESAFKLYDTYGFPVEMTEELAKEHLLPVDRKGFETAFKKHQELSRAGAEQRFHGGLADHSGECTMLHTATHLVHQALRDVLGTHVFQKGSNITRDRLRFDFSHPKKMTPEEIQKTEAIVNAQINADLPVHYREMPAEEALKTSALGLFEERYGEKVKIYFIGDYSKEVCGGPHVAHTGVLASFKIIKEEAVSAGVRRIKAVVEGLHSAQKGIEIPVAGSG